MVLFSVLLYSRGSFCSRSEAEELKLRLLLAIISSGAARNIPSRFTPQQRLASFSRHRRASWSSNLYSYLPAAHVAAILTQDEHAPLIQRNHDITQIIAPFLPDEKH
jgi:hypothetical protein